MIDNSILRDKKKDFCSKIYHEPESLVKVITNEIFLSLANQLINGIDRFLSVQVLFFIRYLH